MCRPGGPATARRAVARTFAWCTRIAAHPCTLVAVWNFGAESAEHYVNVAAEHLKENSGTLEDIARAKGLL